MFLRNACVTPGASARHDVASGAALVLLTLASSLVVGCGRSHLFYDARELRHAPLQQTQAAAITQAAVDQLGGRSVTWVNADGKEANVAAADIKRLGLAERGALWLALSTGEVGGESDVRVRVGKGSTPVTVTIALNGAVRVESGRRERDDGPAPDIDALRERFGLSRESLQRSEAWSDRERIALEQSFATLAPRELAAVRDLRFARAARPRNNDPTLAALFHMNGCAAAITVFASGVRADAFRFVGDASDPKSAVLHSLVHEIGHAFEQAAARASYCAAGRARGEKRNALVRAGNALVATNPVLEGYLQALDGQPAPTDYGNASPHESFAESFALFHVDPHALQRARPKVFAWFARGGHLGTRPRA